MRTESVTAMVFVLAAALGGDAIADNRFGLQDVKGRYVFSFEGEVVGVGPVAATGYLVADGKGNIVDARRTVSINGAPQTESFTCTVTVDPDGMGSAYCPLDDPRPGFPDVETFDFILTKDGQSFRYVGTTLGIVVLGSGQR
jgi:hypothetical protein